MEQRKLVRVEKAEKRLLGVVYGGGALGREVLELLRKRGLRVIFADATEAEFPVLEKPDYVIFFASQPISGGNTEPSFGEKLRRDWREAAVTAKRNGAKLFLCLDNLAMGIAQRLVAEAKELDWPAGEVKIAGKFSSHEELQAAAEKIVRKLFSSGESNVGLQLVGRQDGRVEPRQYTSDVSDRPIKERTRRFDPAVRPSSRWKRFLFVGSAAVILFFLPFLAVTVMTGWGAMRLFGGEKLLVSGRFDEAKAEAEGVEDQLGTAADLITFWGGVAGRLGLGSTAEKYYDLLLVGKSAARGLGHLAVTVKTASGMINRAVAGTAGIDMAAGAAIIKPELTALDADLGLVEGQWSRISGVAFALAPWVGVPANKLADVPQRISQARELVARGGAFLDVLPKITGQATGEKKTYLVVLQNSSELRPTGGFIGSYAIVNFDSGRLLNFKINDVYSADGQLRGWIQPPDEILHFLGQPSWFMRDANWAADFPLTAKRLEWFLEKETGEKVAGVWAVSLPAVQKLLAATGPLELPDLNETVSAGDFFHKAEYTAEINFFPGSTQKKDFLGATSQALLEKLSAPGEKNWRKLVQSLGQALAEKDILFYFDDDQIQGVAEATGWSGTIAVDGCTKTKANCLMIVEANVGANKTNFFLSRSVAINTLISKGGEVDNQVVVRYQNNSPGLSWPGGLYKDFVRFLVPMGSGLTGFDLGDGRKPVVSPVLTAEALSGVAPDQFLVFKNTELSGKSRGASDSAWLSFGTYFEVPVGETRTVTFSYRPEHRISFSDKKPELAMWVLRQPGGGSDSLDLTIDYPGFLTPVEISDRGVREKVGESAKLLVFPQKTSYTSDLTIDRNIKIWFDKN